MRVSCDTLWHKTGESIAQTYPRRDSNLARIGRLRLEDNGSRTRASSRKEWVLKHDLCAVLQLAWVESAHRASGLCEGVVCFADVDTIEEIEHIQTQLEPALLCQSNPPG